MISNTVGRWNGLLVFNYHRVGDGSTSLFDRAIYSASQEEFDRQVSFLKKGFDIVRVDDLDDVMRHRQRAVMITFDDGYRDNYEFAFPILKQHSAPATFFLTSGFLDAGTIAWWDEIAWMVRSATAKWLYPSRLVPELIPLSSSMEREEAICRLLSIYKTLSTDQSETFLNALAHHTGSGRASQDLARDQWMSWEMIREMDQSGMDIGGHTISHPVLSQSSTEEQREEIFGSKSRIESMLGHPITAFSYPVGQPDSFTEQTQQLLHEAGYRWAFSFSGGFALPGKVDQLNVPRVAVAPHISQELFQSTAKLPWLFA